MNRSTLLKKFSVATGIASLLVLLAACGSGSDQEPPAKPAPVQQAAAATNSGTAAAPTQTPSTATDSDAAATPPPQQVSETDDGSEAIDEPVPVKNASAPVLRLASTAKPEPKPAASQFKEGVHYQRLAPAQPTNVSPGQVEVVEFFWYGCPHCFALDPALETWRQKNKPSYVVFTRVPAAWNDVTSFHGRVFYTAELLGKRDELHTPIFREIHLNGNMLNTMDKVKAFFTAHDVDKASFDKTFASFTLEKKLQDASVLNKRYHVSGVPYFVVNGKYTTDVGTAGGEEQLLQLLNELAAREHGG